MERLTSKETKEKIKAINKPNVEMTKEQFLAIYEKLLEFEDFMEEMDFESLDDLKKTLDRQFEIKQNPRHLGREINGVYFTNEQCYILSQFSEFNTSYLKKYKDIQQENQALKDRWQKLKEWIDYCSSGCLEYEEILQKMEELEKE